jgi:UPF0755 protein
MHLTPKIISSAVVIAVLTLTLSVGAVFLPLGGRPNEQIVFEIPKGASLNQIADALETQGLVLSSGLFKWTTIALGKRRALKTGEYNILGRVSVVHLIDIFDQGRTLRYRVTIPEGLRMTEIFSLLQDLGVGDYDAYLDYSHKTELLEPFGLSLTSPSLEGFLYPETYFFSKSIPESQVIQTMLRTFFASIPDDYEHLAQKVGLTFYEAVILASIIEKETSVPSERTLISSVFHNRLNQRMRLQTDPTVIYGIPEFNGRLTRQLLLRQTPYNTYLNLGLPPTPIANPGLDSLLAAVKPDQTDYLFFVAKGDGSHYFSSNYRDHRQAVESFQLNRRPDYRSY